jgi:hypothetical protein
MIEHVQVGKEAMEKTVGVRKNLLLEKSQAMVLAAYWSTLEDIEMFSLFTEILNVDTIFSTNKEKHLMLVLELGRTTICVIFQCFDGSYLLRRYG